MTQPTNDELERALTEVSQVISVPGGYQMAIEKLRGLRDRRTTWFGTDECRLRYSIDVCLQMRDTTA